MASLQALLAEKQKLDHQIALMQSEARAAAIAKVRQLMAEYGLTATDLTEVAKKAKRRKYNQGKPVAPKYRNPATGETWTGRGLKPKWLTAALAEGKTLEAFAICRHTRM